MIQTKEKILLRNMNIFTIHEDKIGLFKKIFLKKQVKRCLEIQKKINNFEEYRKILIKTANKDYLSFLSSLLFVYDYSEINVVKISNLESFKKCLDERFYCFEDLIQDFYNSFENKIGYIAYRQSLFKREPEKIADYMKYYEDFFAEIKEWVSNKKPMNIDVLNRQIYFVNRINHALRLLNGKTFDKLEFIPHETDDEDNPLIKFEQEFKEVCKWK